MTYRYWELEIDGPDKTGKDLLCKYLCELSHYRFSINVRGIISQMVYTSKYHRDDDFDLRNFSKDKILIILTGETDDLEIRCKLTHEPPYDIDADKALFDAVAHAAAERYIVYEYNTSYMTPYAIAKDVIEKIDKMEEK